ncbi:uncharacterized protein LOC127258473 [Andrographis paniculata]|uniref:uncharacterized protein LOC127258473 n=1 Tax=Andrographis paniculata TaxID=175694 RepID=UPI0021E8AFC4|nr:uncharacterized protein LOC127258473 [Andrographis paniculata]
MSVRGGLLRQTELKPLNPKPLFHLNRRDEKRSHATAAMASDDLHDVARKPRLLRSLLRDYIPDAKHPFSNPLDMSFVVSVIKTHSLLSESAPQPTDDNVMNSWKLAVDSWMNRLLTLASSNLQEKCWAGICLLGITCLECSSERFVSSYDVWLNKLLSQIQLPEISPFVKVASCATISDLLTRLSGFANAKKDATSHASRVVPLVVKLLNEDKSSIVLEEAVCLICTLINLFPISVQRHYDSVEVAIASRLLLDQGCGSMFKKLGYSLSLLPKSRGDADSWSLLMDKILLCMNNLLTAILNGLEEEARSSKTTRALFPSGKEPPAPLGGPAVFEQISDLSARRPERLLGSRISVLMQCCCNLLTNTYPVMVSVPIHAIIYLAERALLIDCSLLPSSYEFLTTMDHDFICSEIPLLQLHSLEILASVIEGLGSQTLPHVASIMQLLSEYLRRSKVPDLRRKSYLIVKVLLMSMGIGITMHVSQAIVNNVFIDLDVHGGEKDCKSASSYSKVHTGSHQKKRKHSNTEKSIQEQPAIDTLEVETARKLTPISVRIAALEALDALLTVGGSLRAENWRGNVDRLLISVATNACKRECSMEERFLLSSDPSFTWEDFQLAALRTLLASILCPNRVRPPHLGPSLELFQRGAQATGTKLAEYCRHALLALEALIHPRALPLDLDSSSDGYKFQSHKLPDRQVSTYKFGELGKGNGEPESEEDNLNETWLGNDDDMEDQETETQQTADDTERLTATARAPELPSVNVASAIPMTEKNRLTTSANVLNSKFTDATKDHMLESQVRNTRQRIAEDIAPIVSERGNIETASVENKGFREMNSTPFVSDLGNIKSTSVENKEFREMNATPEREASEPNDDKLNTIVERISATLVQTSTVLGVKPDDDSDIESIPDIVDEDPDSD